jgi:hypothetical protein
MQLFSVNCQWIVYVILIVGVLVSPDPGKGLRAQSDGAKRGSSTVVSNTRITGTYTNMIYHQEAGDLLGEELKIVMTRKGYQGALQFSEGEPDDLIIVNIRIDGKNVNFTIPTDYAYAGQFAGTIENGILKGKFLFKTGGRGIKKREKLLGMKAGW